MMVDPNSSAYVLVYVQDSEVQDILNEVEKNSCQNVSVICIHTLQLYLGIKCKKKESGTRCSY